MNTYLGMGQELKTQDIGPEVIQSSKYLYLTGYLWDTESQKKAVLNALGMFANFYSDEEVIQWGVVTGPLSADTCAVFDLTNNCFNFDDYLFLYSNLNPFSVIDEVLPPILSDFSNIVMLAPDLASRMLVASPPGPAPMINILLFVTMRLTC
mgnify:CR=1 FL=1